MPRSADGADIMAINIYGSYQMLILSEETPGYLTHSQLAVAGRYLAARSEHSKPWISRNSTVPEGCASQVLFRINACVTAVAAAFAITLVMSATASAQGHHRTGGAGHQRAAHSSEERPVGASSGSITDHGVNRAERPTDDADLPESVHPGHDKCKRQKGDRPQLPWCTDPASGWMGSTTLRVRTIPPEPRGICDVGSVRSCRP